MPRGATQWYVVPARDAVPSGGVTGLLVSLKGHQIASGRIYMYDAKSKLLEPASGWIRTA